MGKLQCAVCVCNRKILGRRPILCTRAGLGSLFVLATFEFTSNNLFIQDEQMGNVIGCLFSMCELMRYPNISK